MVKYSLEGVDGNAFAVMGYTARALKAEGLDCLAGEMYNEATRSNYDNLLAVCNKYIDKCNEASLHNDEEDF